MQLVHALHVSTHRLSVTASVAAPHAALLWNRRCGAVVLLTKLLLACGIPTVEHNVAKIGIERKRIHLHSHSSCDTFNTHVDDRR